MPHISSRNISPSKQKEIETQFKTFFRSIPRSLSIDILFDQLFTETEQIMLAKRLAVLILLSENVSFYKISSALNVSTSTVERLDREWSGGTYKNLEKVLSSRKAKREMLTVLGKILRGGLPEQGRGRWKWLDEIDEKYKSK
jgi:uncharacterized protein YerC